MWGADARDEPHYVFLRRPAADASRAPNRALVTLVERTAAAARRAADLRAAIDVVLRDVADVAGWTAGHAWVPGTEPGTWVSSRLWHPEDGLALGGLRRACVEAPAGPAFGHLSRALSRQASEWTPDLAETPVAAAAAGAGVVAVVGCPVYAAGAPVAVLEWYLATAERPSPEVTHVLGHLAVVLGEVAEQRQVPYVPEQGTMSDGRTGARRLSLR